MSLTCLIPSFHNVVIGSNLLGIEESVAWATPGQFTTANIPCGEGGSGCGGQEGGDGPHRTQFYVDPSAHVESVQRKLKEGGHIMV